MNRFQRAQLSGDAIQVACAGQARDREIVWLLRALLLVSIVGVLFVAWDAVD